MKYNTRIKKYLHLLLTILVISLILTPNINGNLSVKSYSTKVNTIKNFSPILGFELALGFLNPGVNIFLLNIGNDTFRGNISCKLDIDVPITIFGNFFINISNKNIEIKPQEKILLYKGLILGFGQVVAYLDSPYPINIYEKLEGFLLLFFLFFKINFFFN